MRKKVAPLGILLKEEQKLIGTCGFIKYDVTEHKTEIAYALSRKYWGRGLATEAALAFLTMVLMSYVLTVLKLDAIQKMKHLKD
ncbi:hypothetical protein II1_00986 [Bacillus cereus MC118]|uniref:N-acetyltransferase domain-containing protein n=1 Tax=Bacillus cereus MC67 TaxID=1053219 RepID=J8EKX5_BACCE|nr:hypothetical protein II3_04045 [Bacillus cereus MC67]EOP18812.1 hypothetical protein II1_00986 [Bacillus cereus MC118]